MSFGGRAQTQSRAFYRYSDKCERTIGEICIPMAFGQMSLCQRGKGEHWTHYPCHIGDLAIGVLRLDFSW